MADKCALDYYAQQPTAPVVLPRGLDALLIIAHRLSLIAYCQHKFHQLTKNGETNTPGRVSHAGSTVQRGARVIMGGLVGNW